jgi:cytidylate kinase
MTSGVEATHASSPPVVTVDGPAGSGKSTLGRRLAIQLALPFVDTGLFYRGLLVAALRAGVSVEDGDALAALAARTRLEINVDPRSSTDRSQVRIDGEEAGPALRDPRHASMLSVLSREPAVRAALLRPQRALAAQGAVAAGRDCGTVVFPDATLKIYLEAPEAVRTGRRAAEVRETLPAVDDELLREEIGGRDDIDSQRVVAPLQRPPDARVIDTSSLGIEEMVAQALAWCRDVGLLR